MANNATVLCCIENRSAETKKTAAWVPLCHRKPLVPGLILAILSNVKVEKNLQKSHIYVPGGNAAGMRVNEWYFRYKQACCVLLGHLVERFLNIEQFVFHILKIKPCLIK